MISFLTNPQAIGTTVFLVAIDYFGTEAVNWETETLWDELEHLTNDSIPMANKEKISAINLLYTSNRFSSDPIVFSRISNTIGGENTPTIPGVFDPPEVDEAAWAVSEALLHQPLEQGEELKDRFSDRVHTFLRELLIDRRFYLAPSPLDFIELPGSPRGIDTLGDDMVQAVWDLQRRNRDLVAGYVRERMERLLDQLEKLRLENGSTVELVDQLHEVMEQD